jgi:hypothetical protein
MAQYRLRGNWRCVALQHKDEVIRLYDGDEGGETWRSQWKAQSGQGGGW